MKVLSKLSGKAIWLFETVELNPLGLDLHPVYLAVKNKYGFSTPKTRDEVDSPKDGIKFENGNFSPNGSESFAVTLTVFGDGLVADATAGTGCAEAFLEDAVAFVQKQQGLFFEPSMVGRRRYGSQLLIESDRGLSRISESIADITAQLGAETGRKYQTSCLKIAFDPTEPIDGLGPFLIERRTNVPFALNRYFSSAPVRTEAHISLLERFEQLMA